MKALLLNSGLGSRMGKLTEDKPKCMCPIGKNYSIISWQLELIRRNGIKDVIITTGPFEDLLRGHVLNRSQGLNITFVNNPIYKETNYIYSMFLAKDFLNDDILLLHGDLVLEPSVFSDILSSKGSVVAVDSLLPLPEKDFKAKLENGLVKAVGVEFFGDDCKACQPAYKFDKIDFTVWIKEIEAFCKAEKIKVYAENAFNSISNQLDLYPMELNLRLCNEIDNLQDLEIISERFRKLF